MICYFKKYSYLDINNHKYLRNPKRILGIFFSVFNGTFFLVAYLLLDLENKLI